LLSQEVPQSIQESVKKEDDIKKVWATILAICILKKHYSTSKGEWTMMVKKAEAYLKSKQLKDYKNEIASAMSLV